MQRMTRQTRPLVSALLLGTLCSSGFAQIGPNPGEIPSARVSVPLEGLASALQVTDEPTEISSADLPSRSESVRPAIDELLLLAADDFSRKQTQTPLPNDSVVRDLHAASESESLPIGLPAKRSVLIGDEAASDELLFDGGGYVQTIIALLGVILLILGLGQVYKRLARTQGGLVGQLGAGGTAPSGILEVIGRYPISKGMTLVVLKFDRRVLLLSHASSSKGKWGQGASMQVLCELSDAEDIASILLKARSASGDSIAQSFEQTLREADELTDEHLRGIDTSYSEVNPVRFPSPRTEPARTITTAEGDRAELWSSGQNSQAASGVLRKRLASMRREQQG